MKYSSNMSCQSTICSNELWLTHTKRLSHSTHFSQNANIEIIHSFHPEFREKYSHFNLTLLCFGVFCFLGEGMRKEFYSTESTSKQEMWVMGTEVLTILKDSGNFSIWPWLRFLDSCPKLFHERILDVLISEEMLPCQTSEDSQTTIVLMELAYSACKQQIARVEHQKKWETTSKYYKKFG